MIQRHRSHGRRQGGQSYASLAITIILGLIVVGGCSAGLSAATTVEYGNVAAVSRFGELTGTLFRPGLNWKTPFIEGVETYNVQVKTYETSANPDTTNADYPDYRVSAQTSDGQQIDISYTVIFLIEPDQVINVLNETGHMEAVVENVVKAESRSWARKLAQGFQAEGLFSGDGIQDYEDTVKAKLIERYAAFGVTLKDFLVRKIDFEPEYVNAIEAQQIEQERIQTEDFASQAAEFEARREAELAKGQAQAEIERSRGDAEARVIRAEAEAEARIVAAEAEARAIQLQGEALAEYPEFLQLQFIQNLEGVDWGLLPSDGLQYLLPLQGLNALTPEQ